MLLGILSITSAAKKKGFPALLFQHREFHRVRMVWFAKNLQRSSSLTPVQSAGTKSTSDQKCNYCYHVLTFTKIQSMYHLLTYGCPLKGFGSSRSPVLLNQQEPMCQHPEPSIFEHPRLAVFTNIPISPWHCGKRSLPWPTQNILCWKHFSLQSYVNLFQGISIWMSRSGLWPFLPQSLPFVLAVDDVVYGDHASVTLSVVFY